MLNNFEVRKNLETSIEILNKLGEQFTISGNKVKVISDKSLSVDPKTGLLKDFSGSKTELIKQFLKEISVNSKKTFAPAPTKPTSKKAPEITKEDINQKELELILNDIEKISAGLNEDHLQKYIEKRACEPINYHSLSVELLKELQAKYNKSKVLNYFNYKFKQGYEALIIQKSIEGKNISCRFYSFDTTKKAKKLSLKSELTKYSSYPFLLETITPDIKTIVITEGEDKAISGNYNIKDNSVTFISVNSINIHKPLLDVIENNLSLFSDKEIIILFDKEDRKDKKIEEIQAYNLALKLQNNLDNVFISELPLLTDKNDLDNYLKNIAPENRTTSLRKILDDKVTVSQYQNSYNEDLPKTEVKREKPKERAVKHKQLEFNFTSIEDLKQKQRQSTFEHALSGKDGLLNKSPAGLGKTYTSTTELKRNGYKIDIWQPNKILRDNVSKELNIHSEISIADKCLNSLNESNLPIEIRKEKHGIITELTAKGHDARKLFCKNNCGLVDKCQAYKTEFLNDKSIVRTHDKAILSNNIDKNRITVIDENILDKIIKTKTVFLHQIETYKTSKYLKNESLNELFSLLLELKTGLKGLNFYNQLQRDCKKKTKKDLQELLKGINLDKDFDFYNVDLKELKFLPDLNLLKNLIKALKESPKTFDIQNGFISFNYKEEIKTGDKFIYLDATGNKTLLKAIGIKISRVIDDKVNIPNINFLVDYSSTYNTSTLYEDLKTKSSLKKSFIDLLLKLGNNEKTLLICTKEIKDFIDTQKLLPDNFIIINYGSDNKGTNDYKDCINAIALPPKINTENIIKTGHTLFNDINNEKYSCDFVPTGLIENNKEIEVTQQIVFKDQRLQMILEQQQAAQIYQSLFRVKRNIDDKRNFYLLGNISLKSFGLVPTGRIEIEKNSIKHNLLKNIVALLLDSYKILKYSELKNLIINSEQKADFFKNSIVETLMTSHIRHFPNNIYISIGNLANVSYSLDITQRTFERHFENILKELGLKQGFINREKYIYLYESDFESFRNELKMINSNISDLVSNIGLDITPISMLYDDLQPAKIENNYVNNRYDYIDSHSQELEQYLNDYISKLINSKIMVTDKLINKVIQKINSVTPNSNDYFKYEYLLENLAKNDNKINAAIANNNPFTITLGQKLEKVEVKNTYTVVNSKEETQQIESLLGVVETLAPVASSVAVMEKPKTNDDFIDKETENKIYSLLHALKFDITPFKSFTFEFYKEDIINIFVRIFEGTSKAQISHCLYNYHNVADNITRNNDQVYRVSEVKKLKDELAFINNKTKKVHEIYFKLRMNPNDLVKTLAPINEKLFNLSKKYLSLVNHHRQIIDNSFFEQFDKKYDYYENLLQIS